MSASRHMDALFLGCGMGSLGEPILGRPANHTQVGTKVWCYHLYACPLQMLQLQCVAVCNN